MPKTVCVITAGHLASTPRMVKAADALHEAGYRVRVVSSEHVEWCVAVGKQIAAGRPWCARSVEWSAQARSSLYQKSRLRQRLAQFTVTALGPRRSTAGMLAAASDRIGPELIRLASSEAADLVYSGTYGGLAIGICAARRLGCPCALDLEDFHRGQDSSQAGHQRFYQLTTEIERRAFAEAALLTTSSEPIAEAYERHCGKRPIIIHNVFPLPKTAPRVRPLGNRPLSLFWFSQTVGSGRGLEEAIEAANLMNRAVQIRLLGAADGDYIGRLTNLATPLVDLKHLGPLPPDKVEELARTLDIGLALEPTEPVNRDLCMTNKIFTYLSAGLAIAATDTLGQREVLAQSPGAGFSYRNGEPAALAAGLSAWADNAGRLSDSREASWNAACRRWHWEHPLERGELLAAVARTIGQP